MYEGGPCARFCEWDIEHETARLQSEFVALIRASIEKKAEARKDYPKDTSLIVRFNSGANLLLDDDWDEITRALRGDRQPFRELVVVDQDCRRTTTLPFSRRSVSPRS